MLGGRVKQCDTANGISSDIVQLQHAPTRLCVCSGHCVVTWELKDEWVATFFYPSSVGTLVRKFWRWNETLRRRIYRKRPRALLPDPTCLSLLSHPRYSCTTLSSLVPSIPFGGTYPDIGSLLPSPLSIQVEIWRPMGVCIVGTRVAGVANSHSIFSSRKAHTTDN